MNGYEQAARKVWGQVQNTVKEKTQATPSNSYEQSAQNVWRQTISANKPTSSADKAVLSGLADLGKKISSGISNLGRGFSDFSGVNLNYQQNVSTPMLQQPEKLTTRSILGKIAGMYQSGQTEKANTLMGQFQQFQLDPSAPIFNPYTKPTNRVIASLEARGIDTSKLTKDWFDADTSWQSGLLYNGTTGTPSKPGKRSSDAEFLSYDLYQYRQAEDLTLKAEQEWRAMQEEASYKAKSGRYASEQAIIDSIDMSKYKTLQSMKDSITTGKLLEFNRPIGYSEDALYGTIWAAMNDQPLDGDMYTYMANSYLGNGNKYTPNADAVAKLTLGSDDYAPYSVGSTMEEEMMYFGRDSFDQKFIDENYEKYAGSGDETAFKMINNVVEGVNYTQKLKSEKEAMDADIDYLLQYYDNPEDIITAIKETSDYKDLFDLDDTMTPGKNYGKLKSTTEAIDYRWQDVEAEIRRRCAEKKTDTVETLVDDVEKEPVFVQPEAPVWFDDSQSEIPQVTYNPVTPAPSSVATPTPTPATPTPTPTPTPAQPTATPAPALNLDNPPGLIEKGNININARPVVDRGDGTFSTEDSITLGYDDWFVVVPTVINGKVVDEKTAEEHFLQTGEHLGRFKTEEAANQYAEALHERQEEYYNLAPKSIASTPTQTPAPAQMPASTAAPVNKPAPVQKAPVLTGSEKALNEQARANLQKAAPAVMSSGTDAEKVALQTGKTAFFDFGAKRIQDGMRSPQKWFHDFAVKTVAQGYMGTAEEIHEYESHQQNRDQMQETLDEITAEWKGLSDRQATTEALGNISAEELLQIERLTNDPGESPDYGWGLAKSILEQGDSYQPDPRASYLFDRDWALKYLYREVTGEDPERVDLEAHLAQADLWWNAMNGGNASPIDKMIQANQGNDTDDIEEEVAIPGVNGASMRVLLEKGEDNQFHFAQAVNTVTGEAYGADRVDDVNEILGYTKANPLSMEEEAKMEDLELRMKTLSENIQMEDEYLEDGLTGYQKAQSRRRGLATRYELSVIMDSISGEKVDTGLIDRMDFIFSAGLEAPRTDYLTDNVVDLQVQNGSLPREEAVSYAQKYVAGNLRSARDIEENLAYLDRLGVEIPEQTRANVQAKIDIMREDAKNSAYVMLDGREDFAETAASGMEKAKNGEYDRTARAIATGKFGLEFEDLLGAFGLVNATRFVRRREVLTECIAEMTPEEKNRYFYLLESDGQDAANDYFNMLTDPDKGPLLRRRNEALREETQKFASESTGGAILSGILSFGSNILAGPTSLAYELGSKIQGKVINDYSPAFDYLDFTGSARAGIKKRVTDALGGEGSAGAFIANLFLDAGFAAGDSLINSKITRAAYGVLGGFFSGTRLETMAKGMETFLNKTGVGRLTLKVGGDLANAFPMGMNAAAATYRDVIQRFGPEYEEQAVQLAIATLFAETGSEAITVGNFRESFKAGKEAAEKEMGNLLVEFFKNGAEEFLGEGANAYAEQYAERIVLDQMSTYEQTAQSYIKAGYPETLAYQMADQELWRGVLTEAAVGFISSGFGTTTEYARGKVVSALTGEESSTDNRGITSEDVIARSEEIQQAESENPAAITEADVNAEGVSEAGEEESTNEELPISPGQQKLEEMATERRAQAEANAKQVAEEVAKDAGVLGSAAESDATGAAVAIAATLGKENYAGGKAAAQTIVAAIAGGDPALGAQVVSEVLLGSSKDSASTRNAVIEAAMTTGAGRQALEHVRDQIQTGAAVTVADVDAIFNGLDQDRAANPDTFDGTVQSAIKESRIADRTMEILQSGENVSTLNSAQESVNQATENLGRAKTEQEQASADAESAASKLGAAVDEQLQDAGNPALNAPVEQASNELNAAVNNLQAKDAAVADAEQALETEKKKQTEVYEKVLNDARAQATTEVEQTMEQEQAQQEQAQQEQAQQELQNALAEHPTTKAFTQPVTVQTVNGEQAQITGVFGYTPKGETVYSTPQGYITDSEIDGYSDNFTKEYDDATAKWKNSDTPIKPAAWMKHSLQAVVGDTGELIDIVGLAGQTDGDNPIVMDANGNIYDSMDLFMQPDPFTGEDGTKALMNAFTEAGGENLPAVDLNQLRASQIEASTPEGVTSPSNTTTDSQEAPTFESMGGHAYMEAPFISSKATDIYGDEHELVGLTVTFGGSVGAIDAYGDFIPFYQITKIDSDFAQWAIDNVYHLGEDNFDHGITMSASQEELHDVTSALQNLISNSSTEQTVSAAPEPSDEYSEGKVNPATNEPLKNWQDPKYHGKVKVTHKKEKPKSAKFKKWFNRSAPEARVYLTNDDGSPRIFFRGYGDYGRHQYVEHESHQVATNDSGQPMYKNFYMALKSTAQTYAGTTKIAKFRDVVNWETAKAGMKDIGMDLVEAPNPNNPSQMGYQVMYKNKKGKWVPAIGAETTWFAEDQLSLFRHTYGGNLQTHGIHAGFIVAQKPLIIHGRKADWSSIPVGHITAPNGDTLTGTPSTDAIAKWAFKHGYDTVILDDISDDKNSGGEKGIEIITSRSEQFKSIWNNGEYGINNPNILAMKKGSTQKDVTAPESEKTGELEKLMGKPVSDKFNGIVKKLFSGENVDRAQLRAELEETDEVKFQRANERQGSSLDPYLIEDNKNYPDWASRVESQLSPGRRELHKQIRDTLDKQGSAVFDKNGKVSYTGKVKQGKRLDLIVGLAASGKSTIADHISATHGSRFMDSDMVKELLPEYDGGLNADYVHEESKFINDQRMTEAIARGDNILLSIIGNDPKFILKRTQAARNAGYEVHLHMTDLNADKALGRALSRYAKTGRFIGLDYMFQDYSADIKAAFDMLKNEGGIISGYTKWNTDVAQGQQPILTESSSADEAAIFAQGDPGERGSLLSGALASGGRGNELSLKTGMDNGGSGGRLTPTQRQAEEVKAKYSPATIAKKLTRDLGLGDYIGTRKFGMSKATQAYYDRHSGSVVARNKNAGNFIVTMHELGHAIADRFGLTATNELVDNFVNDPSPESGIDVSAYDPADLPGEAMAEFMWRYMEGEQGARQFAGDQFYDTFEAAIRGTKEGKAIAEAREQMQMWLNADTNSKIGSTIKNRSDKTRTPLRERFRQAIVSLVDSTAAAANFDEATGANSVMDSVRAQAAWANTAGKQATSILMGAGLTDAQGRLIGPSMADRIADTGFKATDENLDLLNRYWLAKHSLARDEQGKPVFDEHITKEERKAFIHDIETNHPEVAAAQQAIIGFWHDFMQEFMVNTGRLTQEAFDEMNAMYPDYAPTFRVKSTDGIAQRTGKGKTFTVQRASGSTENIYNPFDSLCGMVNTIVGQNALNRVGQTFDRMYQKNEGLGAFARQVIHENETKASENLDMSKKQQQVRDLVGNMIDADTLNTLLGIVGNGGFTQTNVASHDTLKVVRDDGTVVEYQFEDMELFKLLAGINDKTSNAALEAVGFVTRAMSALTTGSNPIFAARNFMRDFQNSVNYGSWASNYGTGAIKWLRSAVEVWRGESQDTKDYEALGGGGWTRIDPSRVASRNELYSGIFEGYDRSNVGKTAKWAGKKVWNAITLARLNEVIEQTSRFAEYKYGKHDLSTQEGKVEAFLAAQEATVDFNRAGNSNLATMVKKLVPFFNASTQGVYRTGRMLTEAERGRAPARLTKTIVNTALLSALCNGLLLKNMDDDDKKEFEMLSDDLKSNHFFLPNFAPDILGQAPLIRIPLAQDPLTYAIHGAVTNALWNGQTEDGLMVDLASIANTILDNLNPIGSGTVLAPILAINANKSWFGSRIVPSHLERNKYAPDQYTEETPDIFRWAGRVFNMSPLKAQYLAEQYTGFLGQLAIPALSMNSRGELGGLPAAINAARKRFVSDPLTSNDVVSSFYDAADILNSVIEETNQGKPLNILRRGLTQEEAGQAYEEAKSLTSATGIVGAAKSQINALYNEIDEINERPGLSDQERYQLTSEKRRKMIEIAAEANEALGAYTEKYVTGGNMTVRMLTQGSASYRPTEEEKLPQVFKDDEDQMYMQRSKEVYDATGKSSALPHPSQKLTITDRLGNQEDYAIPDEDWDRYTEIYKVAYESYMVRKGGRWNTLTDKQKQQLLTSAHSAGNKAMREQYAREHGIQMKK